MNYNGAEGTNQNGEYALEMSTSRVVQEPGPIGDDAEEKQDINGLQGRNGVPVVWTPPTFRTYRKYWGFDFIP